VLQRNIGESIRIGDDIKLTLVWVEELQAGIVIDDPTGTHSMTLDWNEPRAISRDVSVSYTELRSPTKIRIGIEAPKYIAVHRDEVWLAIKRQNRATAKAEAKP
jgi:carbon storage regulator CsrA